MSEWVTLQVFTMQQPSNKLSAPFMSPGAFRDMRTWIWFGAVALTGIGTWWGLIRLALMANAMHRPALAVVVLFVTLLIALAAAWLVAGALLGMLPYA